MDAAQQEAIALDAYYPVLLVEKLLFSHADWMPALTSTMPRFSRQCNETFRISGCGFPNPEGSPVENSQTLRA
jgi:hypothetical protein